MMRLQDEVSCILEELRIYLEPTFLTICTLSCNMMADQNAREMNERVRNINEIIRQIQQRSVLPMRVLDVARMMEDSLPEDASSDGIHFDHGAPSGSMASSRGIQIALSRIYWRGGNSPSVHSRYLPSS